MRRDAVVFQLARIFRELRAVGGQRQFVERARTQVARQRADQRHDAAPDQRLAAGEAKLAHARARRRREHSRSSSSSVSRSAFGRKVMFSAMQ